MRTKRARKAKKLKDSLTGLNYATFNKRLPKWLKGNSWTGNSHRGLFVRESVEDRIC
jgi:hypothetical protein